MFVWGKADQGQLGLGGIEDTFIPVPRWNKHIGAHSVKEVACGQNHTLILLENGRVLSCGSNEFGQLGQDQASTRPAEVSFPEGVTIQHVSCGHSHCVALSNHGQLFSWGDNTYGQLGVGKSNGSKPIHVEALSNFTVVQATCGGHHTMALAQDGHPFSWGQNTWFQLGHSTGVSSVSTPLQIQFLESLPVAQIAAGQRHSLVLSVSGAVFGWGKNNLGQLGVGHQSDTILPTKLTTLNSYRVKYIVCGDDHTAVLTESGGVFTFGAGGCGQLGHNSTESRTHPTEVAGLTSDVSQIACGRCHTLAMIKHTGKVYSFGLGANGQLGTSTVTNLMTPVPVCGTWLPPTSVQEEGDLIDFGTPVDLTPEADQGSVVKRVFAGGDQSFVSVVVTELGAEGLKHTMVHDSRIPLSSQMPFFLTFERVKQLLDVALITKATADVIRTFERVFAHPAMINGSFLTNDIVSEKCSCVDIVSARQAFELMRVRLKGTDFDSRLQHCLSSLLPSLPSSLFSPECARIFYILPAYIMQSPSLNLMVPFMEAFLKLDVNSRSVIGDWLFSESREYLHLWLMTVKDEVSKILLKSKHWLRENEDKSLIGPEMPTQQFTPLEGGMLKHGLRFLKCIHDWNVSYGEVISYADFHLRAVTEVVDLLIDFFNWAQKKPNVIVFCQFPFVLDAEAKAELMKYESKLHMQFAVAQAQQQNFASLVTRQMIADFSPFAFELNVDRHNLVNNTLNQLISTDPKNYKKPLKVVFIGEEGEDVGGVQKEFFMLLLQEILNPDFGMFVEDDESHFVWFREQELFYESLDYFVLVGILCGLAIYNSVIIDLPFPTALYKKLLKRPTELSDLTELHPSVGINLKYLLEYTEDDFEENFALNFAVSRSHFGEVQSVDLVPDGTSIPVTVNNRQEYVDSYVKYIMTEAVRKPFDAFESGFMRVCDGQVLDLFHPKELMVLVMGSQVVDWNEMEQHMQYRSGYSPDHPTIRHFWKVFHNLPTDAKRKFLVFYTGSNRIPVTGIKSMQMIIQGMDGGIGCERLPVAHTCFNVLDLPPYRTEEKMKQKLLQAINFTSGFGII